jgi:small conductance mechanosensitive channel
MPQGLLDSLSATIPLHLPDTITKVVPLTPSDLKHLDKTTAQVLDHSSEVIFRISLGIVIIVLGWVVSSWLASVAQRALIRLHVEETLAAFLGSTLRFVVFFATLIAGMGIMGVNSTSLAAVLGAAGLAIGLAMKGTLGHVASGMMVMVHRPFKVGDWIQNGDFSGTVKRIGLFSTEINTQDFVRVFIPNSVLWENPLQNYTYNRMRMIKFAIRLPYDADVRAALKTMNKVVSDEPLILKTPEPKLGVDTFSAQGIECIVWVWVRTEDYGKLRYDFLMRLKEALAELGILLRAPEQRVQYAAMTNAQPQPEPKLAKKAKVGKSARTKQGKRR